MNSQDPNEKTLEQAALYALGLLENQEKELFEKLLAKGCERCQAVKDFQNVAELLGASVTPKAPPASLREKLLEKVRMEQGPEPAKRKTITESSEQIADAGFTVIREQDRQWHDIGPSIRVKVLNFDKNQGRMTALARMGPHSAFRPHEHLGSEEFYVLEGTCFIGGQLLRVGDYHRAEAGTFHDETSTEEGCLMLTIFSPSPELLQALA